MGWVNQDCVGPVGSFWDRCGTFCSFWIVFGTAVDRSGNRVGDHFWGKLIWADPKLDRLIILGRFGQFGKCLVYACT